jgi:hypothetical protein
LVTFLLQLRVLISLIIHPGKDLFSFDRLQLLAKYETEKSSGLVLADTYYRKQEAARKKNEAMLKVQNGLRLELREIEEYRLPEAEREVNQARDMLEKAREEIDNHNNMENGDGDSHNSNPNSGKIKSQDANKEPSSLPSHSTIDLSESSDGGITDSLSVSPPTSASPPSRIDTSQYFLEDDNELQEMQGPRAGLQPSAESQPAASNSSNSSAPNTDDPNSYFVSYSSPQRTASTPSNLGNTNSSSSPGGKKSNSFATATGLRQLWNGISGQNINNADEPSSQHRVALLEGAESDNSAGLSEIGPGLQQSTDGVSTTAAGTISSSGSFREFEELRSDNTSENGNQNLNLPEDLSSHDPSDPSGNQTNSDDISFPGFLRGLFGSRGRRAFVQGVRRSVGGSGSTRDVMSRDDFEMDDVTGRMHNGYSRFGDSGGEENGNAGGVRGPGGSRNSRDRNSNADRNNGRSSRRKKSGRAYSSIRNDGESDSGIGTNDVGSSSSRGTSREIRGREIRGREIRRKSVSRPWFLKCLPSWLCPLWLTKLLSKFLPAPLRLFPLLNNSNAETSTQCQKLQSSLSKKLTAQPILPLLLAQKLADACLILEFTFPLSLLLRYTIPFEFQPQLETAFSLKALSKCFCYEFFQIFIKLLFFITYANFSIHECSEFLWVNLMFDCCACFLGCTLAVGDRYADHPDVDMLDTVGEED